MKAKLKRTRLNPKVKASVSPISPTGRFEVYLGRGKTISCGELVDLTYADGIIRALNLYLRGGREVTARGVANEVLSFLRYTLGVTCGVVNKSAVSGYKKLLDGDASIVLNTKCQKFGHVRKFVLHLIQLHIIPSFEVVKNFDHSKVKPNPKDSFSDIARQFIEDGGDFESMGIAETSELLDIGHDEAKNLVFCLECMNDLHNKALLKISEWEDDWNYFESIIKNLSEERVEFIKGLKGLSDPVLIKERTLEDAFGVMYAKFGVNIPSVVNWPKGMEQYFRNLGWIKVSKRIKGIFQGEMDEFSPVFEKVKTLSNDELAEYKTFETFYEKDERFDGRSIELAISMLYLEYGRFLPSSEKWSEVGDYLRARGFSVLRVKSAFFPTTRTIKPFLVGLLSLKELSPNVDTIAQYAYLSSFKPGSEVGKVLLYFDKFRGQPLSREISDEHEIVQACIRHVARMETLLEELGEVGESFLRRDKVPLWLQFTQERKKCLSEDIDVADPSTVTALVKDFIAECAQGSKFLKEILGASGENFRPTNTLIMRLSGETLSEIQKILNHKNLSTTSLYSERVHTQSILKTKAKKFMQYLVSCSKGVEDSNTSLKGETLFDDSGDVVDEWINCDAQRLWFNDVEVIAQWVAWEASISSVQQEIMHVNPERWIKYWVPRLVRYKSLLALVSVADLNEAKVLAEGIVLPPLN